MGSCDSERGQGLPVQELSGLGCRCGSRRWRGWRPCPNRQDGLLSGVPSPAARQVPAGRAGRCPCPGGVIHTCPPPGLLCEHCSRRGKAALGGACCREGAFCSALVGPLTPDCGVMGSWGRGERCQQRFRGEEAQGRSGSDLQTIVLPRGRCGRCPQKPPGLLTLL